MTNTELAKEHGAIVVDSGVLFLDRDLDAYTQAAIAAAPDHIEQSLDMVPSDAAQAVQAVPGWKLVPICLTPAMRTELLNSNGLATSELYTMLLSVAPQPPAKQSQARLTDTQAQEIADSVTCFSGSYELAIVRATEVALGQIKTGFCKLKAQPDGCPMHNTQCGWPMCDQPPRGE